MSLRLHQKPFWSNCQWIKFRSFSTGFQSKMWLPPIAKLCYCYVAESAKQKYIMSSASPAEIYLNTIFGCIWSSWGTFYQGVLSFTHFSCGCICHRIYIEAMDLWKPEIGVHLAVKAKVSPSLWGSCYFPLNTQEFFGIEIAKSQGFRYSSVLQSEIVKVIKLCPILSRSKAFGLLQTWFSW